MNDLITFYKGQKNDQNHEEDEGEFQHSVLPSQGGFS